MKTPVAYLLAILLHVVILFGITVSKSSPAAAIPKKQYIEVTLVAAPPPPAPLPPPPKVEAAPPPPPPPPPGPPPPPPPEPPPPPPPKVEAPLPEIKSEPPPPPSTSAPATPKAAPAPIAVSTPAPAQPVINSGPPSPVPGQYLNISQPSFFDRVEPDYPLSARRLHQEGAVVLGLYINALGTLDKVEIVKSSGYPALDEAAMDAMNQSRFHPAYQGATPVPAHAEVTINFRLQ